MAISEQARAEIEAKRKANGRILFLKRELMEAQAAQCREAQKTPWTIEGSGFALDGLRFEDYPVPSEFKCYKFSPSAGDARDDVVIVYFHGGGWILESNELTLHFVQRLADDNQCSIIFPIYPLGPTYSYKEAFPFAMEVYKKVLAEYPDGYIFLTGDSAGGYMALETAQHALLEGLPQPTAILPLSPALDVGDTYLEAKKPYDEIDPCFPYTAISWFADFWVPEGEPRNVFPVNPLFGPMKGLAPIHIFSGESEILRVDAQALYDLASEQGVQVEWSLYEGMWHVWFTYLGLPEAEQAVADIDACIAGFIG